MELRKIQVKRIFLIEEVHHGEIGILLGLSNLFKKSRPDTAGVLSGLREALSQDDIADKEEWFKFKKKENILDSEKSREGTKQDVDRVLKPGVMKEMPNKIERHTVEIVFALLSVVLILTTYLPVNLMMADASINLSQYDMKSVTDDINKSLSKLTGENSSDLLKDTIASINNTASQLAELKVKASSMKIP